MGVFHGFLSHLQHRILSDWEVGEVFLSRLYELWNVKSFNQIHDVKDFVDRLALEAVPNRLNVVNGVLKNLECQRGSFLNLYHLGGLVADVRGVSLLQELIPSFCSLDSGAIILKKNLEEVDELSDNYYPMFYHSIACNNLCEISNAFSFLVTGTFTY